MTAILIILIVIAAILFIAYPLALRPNTRRREQMQPFEKVMIAHRGFFDNETEYPENSLPAFQRAVEAGYGIELDVQLTTDEKLVVFHDASLKRMCGIDRKVTECSYAELQQYTLANSSQKIPLLDEVLSVIDGRAPLIVEVKPEGNCIRTAELLNARMTDYDGIYCIESFHPLVVAWYYRHQPEVIRGQLSSNFMKENEGLNCLVRFLMSNLLLNFFTKPDFIAYNHKYSDQTSYRLCRKLYQVENAAWTIKSQAELERARENFQIFIFDSFIPKE